MDLSKFKTSDWLMIGGGLGFLIFGTFFDWAKISFLGISASGGNAFDFFLRGTVPWILFVAVGVLAFLLAGGVIKKGDLPWPLILLAAAALGLILNLFIVIAGPGDGLDRAIGLWLSFLSAVVATVGAFMGFQESGGNLADLKDPNKLKASFRTEGAAAGETPPPPPPPPAD